jgi:transcriptional regulator with XRE-family HTH domain
MRALRALGVNLEARRSAEEWVTEDWSAVARAINQRMTELGLRQRELIERSRVSKAAVREIQHNTVQRRRSARTLEALSSALAWHPQHLLALLEGRTPPQLGDPVVVSDNDVPGRLASIEGRLRGMAEQLDQISADLSVVIRSDGNRES